MSEKSQELAIAPPNALGKDIALQTYGESDRVSIDTLAKAVQFAQLMCQSREAIPDKFRGNAGLCLGVTMDALSAGLNPYALARSAYIVGSAIAYEAKVHTAMLNTSKLLKTRLRATYTGKVEGKHSLSGRNGPKEHPSGDLQVTITGHVVGEDEPFEYTSPKLSEITTKNSPLWDSDPRVQLYYYATRAWARMYLPEVGLGALMTDEMEDSNIEPEAPKPTLLERVKVAREQDPTPLNFVDVEQDDAGAAEPEAAAEPAEAADATDAAAEAAPAENEGPAPEAEAEAQPQETAATKADSAAIYETAEAAFAELHDSLEAINTVAECGEYILLWNDFVDSSFEEKQAAEIRKRGQNILSRRKIEIRKKEHEHK